MVELKVLIPFAFFLGGILYDHYGINGAASWGIVSSAMELLCVIVFFYLDGLEKQKVQYESIERQSTAQSSKKDDDNQSATTGGGT